MKIFNLKKFKEVTGCHENELDLKLRWPQMCDGKTVQEIELMGYGTCDAWMVDDSEDGVKDDGGNGKKEDP